jgi:hypothetical protein
VVVPPVAVADQMALLVEACYSAAVADVAALEVAAATACWDNATRLF